MLRLFLQHLVSQLVVVELLLVTIDHLLLHI